MTWKTNFLAYDGSAASHLNLLIVWSGWYSAVYTALLALWGLLKGRIWTAILDYEKRQVIRMATKTVRFADLPGETYTYGSDYMHSPVATCSSQRPLQRSSTSQHQHSYMYQPSLNDAPPSEYNNHSPSSLLNLSFPYHSPYSPLIAHTVLPFPSSSSQPIPTQPPPTPDRLRHPINLPPVKENSAEASSMFELHESLRPLPLSIDLSQDISPYILTLRDKSDMSPQDLPTNMTLVSKYLPWRIHISPNSVRDVVIALYTALRTRVTDKEMKAVGGEDVIKAFAKRVERAGEGERRKGVRRVDFLLGYTRFLGIEPSTDEPGVWRICLTPLS
ncbi:hypothetical protein EDD18DRAFT_1367813 [Armillaria luteobubalina]|uniref:DUF6699 domain-containing protein n=1 Tax=Armillaria luteobubalina TaxID=153913 RepID=A0AA39U9L3_9AGAR|nr:hypothetical protein EDD18DRAFT_1367813 [Armillaria luteobubalina]